MYEEGQQQNDTAEKQQAAASQNWTVHAEFTISHDGLAEQGIGPPIAHTEQDENGAVKLVYRWTCVQTHPAVDEPCNAEKNSQPNMLFTSVPPNKPQSIPKQQGGYVRNMLNKFAANAQQPSQPISSGYSSEQLTSPNSNSNSVHNGRRCRSTCSIVLSTNVDSGAASAATSRTQSLRCQTANAAPAQCKASSLYGCGDPWCYHSPNYDEAWPRFSPLIEADEYANAPTASVKSTATKNSLLSTINMRKTCRDASVQTYEMVDKCTSPFLFDHKDNKSDVVSGKLSLGIISNPSRNHRSVGYLTRRKTEPIRRCSKTRECDNMMSMSPDSLDSKKQSPIKRFVQHQVLKQSNLLNKEPSGESLINSGSNITNQSQADKKQPRTVHIDVYCTGTEQETSSSSTSSSDSTNNENELVSSPQTVFESSDVRITHIRADSRNLPPKLAQDLINPQFADQYKQEEKEEEDATSTLYPSHPSSYSAIRDFDMSSFSTNPWSRMSLSSCDTSWKDTCSDLGSLLEASRSSDAATLSLKQRLGESITEEGVSVRGAAPKPPSSFDSFEYAASEDKARIRRLNEDLLHWKKSVEPQVERPKQLIKQKPRLLSDSDDSDESDHSGKGWSFVKTSLDREDTVKQRRLLAQTPSKSPSILIVKQKLSENPELRAPFTKSPGVFSEQRQIARRFGPIIDVYRKPGHHIGPAKNPDCSCSHCDEYLRGGCGRGRTRSVGGAGGAAMDYYRWKKRGSEPPQSREEQRLQMEAATHALTRNTSLSDI